MSRRGSANFYDNPDLQRCGGKHIIINLYGKFIYTNVQMYIKVKQRVVTSV